MHLLSTLSCRFNSIQYTKYCGVCGYSTKTVRDDQTSTGAMCFPHSYTMRHCYALVNSREFLVSPLGLIHIRGSIFLYSTMSAILSQTCDLQCSVTGARMTEKGVEVDFAADLCTEGRLIWRFVSTLLSRNTNTQSKSKLKLDKAQLQ